MAIKIRGSPACLLASSALLMLSALAPAQFLSHDHAVPAKEIRIGMSNAESGRSGIPGVFLKHGCEAYFTRVNAQGGIAGRQLKLVVYDDRGEPINTVQNMEKLINQDRVFTVIALTGTACCAAVLSMINESNLVLLAPEVGADFVRDPAQPLVFAWRASDADEAEFLVAHLTSDLHLHRIGMFRQDDLFGVYCKRGLEEALHRRGLSLAGDAVYMRSSVQVQEAVDEFIGEQPEAIVVASSYKPFAEFVLRARQLGLNRTLFCAFSAVGPSQPLIDALQGAAEGIVISQVVPSPDDNNLSLAVDYRRDMDAIGVKISDYTSFEGYLDAYVLVRALTAIQPDFTEERLRQSLRNIDLSVGALHLIYASDHVQQNHAVFLSQVKNGKLTATDKLKLPWK